MNMVCWIEYPSEPKELLLVWQAPKSVKDRLRWAVGRLTKIGDDASFEYLDGDDFRALNLGREKKDLAAAGYVGYPAFDVRDAIKGAFRHHVLGAFLRRVPSTTRADFKQYLEHFHLRDKILSPFGLLAITEARLPSDGFSLIDPLDSSVPMADVVFEVAGFRHCGITVHEGDAVSLVPEPDNDRDSSAIQVMAAGRKIGYVNRLQAETIHKWLEQRSIDCWIARLNGCPDAPRAYAFLQVRPKQRSVAA